MTCKRCHKTYRKRTAHLKRCKAKPQRREPDVELLMLLGKPVPGKGAGFAKRIAEVNKVLMDIPAPKKHLFEGGEGVNGWLYVQLPGSRKFMGKTPGLLSPKYEQEARRRLGKKFPGVRVWTVLD